MSEFYGDTGEVWDGQEEPLAGQLHPGIAFLTDEEIAESIRPYPMPDRRPWYVRLWEWLVWGV